MTNDEMPESKVSGSNMSLLSRRAFIENTALAGAGLVLPDARLQGKPEREEHMESEIAKEKIRRAMLAGPSIITKDATVAEMNREGALTVLRKGSNEWVCVPGDQNIVGAADMCLDPMGMVWFKDVMARRPRPTNVSPGLIYMLNGATQRSFTDPFDTTNPAIPIGPHWMLLWPFDALAAGMPTAMRDAGTLIMFAGTPYAHLHVCGSPWDGNEYRQDVKAVWTMRYTDGE